MQVGDIISGYEDTDGVFLHTISGFHDNLVDIDIKLYEPEDPDFAWALEQLRNLENN